MKQLIILFILFISLSAKENYELNLFENIFPIIFKENILKIYVDDRYKDIFKNSNKLKVVDSCEDADFVFSKKPDLKCKSKLMFLTKYKYIKNDDVFGVFYYKKGRPQLVLNRKVITNNNLDLPNSLKKYAY